MKKFFLCLFIVQTLIWNNNVLANGQLKLAENHPDVSGELFEMVGLINACNHSKVEERMHPQAFEFAMKKSNSFKELVEVVQEFEGIIDFENLEKEASEDWGEFGCLIVLGFYRGILAAEAANF